MNVFVNFIMSYRFFFCFKIGNILVKEIVWKVIENNFVLSF